jgi:hypothetical protein
VLENGRRTEVALHADADDLTTDVASQAHRLT